MNKRAFNIENLGLSTFYNLPTLGALGLTGMGLGKALGLKKRCLGLGLPAAYAAYLLGKKGAGGFELYNGPKFIDDMSAMINVPIHLGLAADIDLAKNALNGNHNDVPPGEAGAWVLDAYDRAI